LPDVGFGTALALVLLVVAAGGLFLESKRSRREVERLSVSIERLRRLRRALDALHVEASSTRTSTDITTDVFAHRGRR
jgi:hypothetical protein